MPKHSEFTALYRATLEPLRRYLSRLLSSNTDAQDLAQEAYTRVFVAMNEESRVREPQALLYTTAKNLAMNQMRRRHLEPITGISGAVIEGAASSSPGVEQLVMAREEWEHFEKALAGLPAGCRNILLLRRVDRFSPAEIAERLWISRSTVEKQLARALRLLRESFRPEAGLESEPESMEAVAMSTNGMRA